MKISFSVWMPDKAYPRREIELYGSLQYIKLNNEILLGFFLKNTSIIIYHRLIIIFSAGS